MRPPSRIPEAELTLRCPLPAPAEEAFAWHERPGAFERLVPPWERVRIVERSGGLRDGGRLVLDTRIGPLRRRWIAVHEGYEPGRQFRDVAVAGPFRFWRHTHRFEPASPAACALEDRIEYTLPGGRPAHALAGRLVERRLRRLFAWRHAIVAGDLHRLASALEAGSGRRAMRVVVSGSHGLVGSTLLPFLTAGGHQVTRLVRRPVTDGTDIPWDPAAGRLDPARLTGFDGIVHLAGESIASGRWTAARKAVILESREAGTRLIAEAAAAANVPVLVTASAVGWYGDRGDETLTEESGSGTLFLSEVVRRWEAATEPARSAGVRVVRLRFGIVLSPKGGALAKMLTPFRLGAGGKIGSGRQWMSWIALDDVLGAILHALAKDSIAGPVNTVAPHAVTNAEFTRTLARVLGRPAIVPMPALAARLAFGQMGEELLLASGRVLPARLEASGFRFQYPDLEPALRHLLGRGA